MFQIEKKLLQSRHVLKFVLWTFRNGKVPSNNVAAFVGFEEGSAISAKRFVHPYS